MNKRITRAGIIPVMAAGFLISGCKAEKPAVQGPTEGWHVQVGDAAPDFLLVTTDAEKVRLGDYKGKVLVANFFALWCSICRVEVDAFKKELVPEINQHDRVSLVTVDVADVRSRVADFRRENGYAWPFLLDTDGEVFAKYARSGLPRLVLIDPAGKIAALHVGFGRQSIDRLRSEIDALLARMPADSTPAAAEARADRPDGALAVRSASDTTP